MSGIVKRLISAAKVWASHLRETRHGLELDVNDPFVASYLHKAMQSSGGPGVLDDANSYARILGVWARSGFNVFNLGDDFCAAMAMTDTRSIDISLARLPHPAMLFLIPQGFVTGIEGGSYTKIWVAECVVRDRGKEPEPGVELMGSDDMRMLSARVARSAVDASGWSAFSGEMVENTALGEEVSLNGVDVLANNRLKQIVFGTLAFVNASPSALERKNVPLALRRRRGASEAVQWVVGRTVKIDKRLVDVARSGMGGAAFRIKARHVVRGHFRNQACGPGLAERRSMWIEPHWRGPEDGAAIIHTYKPAQDVER